MIDPIHQLRFLAARDVVKLTSLSRAHIYRLVSEGTFPKPVHVDGRRVAWVQGEVEAWMRGRLAARDAGEGRAA